ncbi:hypothetical protein WMF45_45830 [Sorangium sp. So ce448]|uniref:hypothetical protein n=1 Tax=Sorangium sp. So ce448 TaxID=3133314 RepID=UPI003F638998
MQDFEEPRYKNAKTAFEAAFSKGYASGLRDLDEGRAERLPDVSSVFYVDVPEHDVLDDEWEQYVPRFEQAGRHAALATRRTGTAKLDHEWSHPDTQHWNRPPNMLRWIVQLNPSS